MSLPLTPTTFAGSIPETYDRLLGPLIFQPYAIDLAHRLAAALAKHPAPRILELACGTGILTRALAEALPAARITATDFSEPMLAIARARHGAHSPRIEFSQADACNLPFPDGAFDAIACQFGAMFFPDKPRAMREARRVLAPGGVYILSVWDAIDASPIAKVVHDTVADAFPSDPPLFLAAKPHAWHDRAAIEHTVRAGGFTSVRIETLELPCVTPSADDAARALIDGTPLFAELSQRGVTDTAHLCRAAAAALARAHGDRPCRSTMRAVLATAQ